MIHRILSLVLAMLAACAYAQQPPAWHDDLAEHLAGTWKLQGNAPDAPASESRYDSLWFLGYDAVSERYVLHLMDVFGARYSETLGFGTRDGNDVRFAYSSIPTGPSIIAGSGCLHQRVGNGTWSRRSKGNGNRLPT